MKKLLFVTLLICTALPWSCKKYEEDDYWFTLRTPLNRIKGNKRLVEATFNGENLLPIYRNIFGPHYFEFTDKKLNRGKRYYVYVRDSLTNKIKCEGWWKTENANDVVLTTYFNDDEYLSNTCLGESDTNQINFVNGGRITKLSNKELWTEAPNTFYKFLKYEK
jgi:hypothetical protein